MTREFPTEDDALAYVAKVAAGSVRMMSHCRVCDLPCAVSMAASWAVTPNLFGNWVVTKREVERPAVDPCGHGRRVWRRVETAPNPGRACGAGCREASSAFCSCSCIGAAHGIRHRPH